MHTQLHGLSFIKKKNLIPNPKTVKICSLFQIKKNNNRISYLLEPYTPTTHPAVIMYRLVPLPPAPMMTYLMVVVCIHYLFIQDNHSFCTVHSQKTFVSTPLKHAQQNYPYKLFKNNQNRVFSLTFHNINNPLSSQMTASFVGSQAGY